MTATSDCLYFIVLLLCLTPFIKANDDDEFAISGLPS